MLDRVSKAFFHLLASSRVLKQAASRYGAQQPTSFVRRFVAGETLDEAIAAARAVGARGLLQTLDHLGEDVATLAGADQATRDYVAMIDPIIQADISRNISLKLTQLGLDVDRASAVDNLRKILDRAEPADIFVRIDMEDSQHTDITLEVFETLWQQGYRQIGVVLQAALHRTERDLQRINALGARIRLVKGAYSEPTRIAHQKKRDVDLAYARLLKILLRDGHYPALATHDPGMIDVARQWATEHSVASDRFEFQLLYGIRRDLQARLVRDGYRVRIYIPFGREWFPYFMRRLGERPANIAFLWRGIADEKR